MSEEQAQPRRTEPVGLLVNAFGSVRQAGPLIVLAYFAIQQGTLGGGMLVGLFLLMALGQLFVAWLQWYRTTYVLGAEDIRVESGVLARAARSVPYERIQDVSLEQALLPRLFGLVSVRFETGAGGGEELSLAYLREADGERLRHTVRERREEAAPVEVGAMPDVAVQTAPEEPARTLFSMGPGRVFTFGLFEFSLAVIAVLLGLTQQFDFLLPSGIWEAEWWQEQASGQSARLSALGTTMKIIGALSALGTIIALGMVTGVVRTTLREWGFLLEETSRGFRRRRGLLTRTDVVMPVHRVQAMQVATRVIRRRFGWHGLQFVSLAHDSESASHPVAPFARMEEIWPVARAAGFAPPSETLEWHHAAKAYRSDSVLIAALLPLIFAWIPAVIGYPMATLIPIGIAIFLCLVEWIAWENARHALDGHQVLARRGWLAPRLDIAPMVKLQSVEFSQGPLARMHGYGTLHLGLAGGTLAIPGVPMGRAMGIREAILAQIATRDFSELNRREDS